MTIKKQFVILSSFIIAIPILCTLFILIYGYFTSSNRILLHGYKAIVKSEKIEISNDELNSIYKAISILPPDIQAVLLTEDFTVLLSSIPNFRVNTTLTQKDFWSFIERTSDKYFYQFTNPTEEQRTILVTRVDRYKNKRPKGKGILLPLIIFIYIMVLVCFFFIIRISRNIFGSIINLEKDMKQLADGNLAEIPQASNKKEFSNEISSISENLEKTRSSLVEAQNRKYKFIMGISHDLRTPVAIIKGYTEALSDEVITDKNEVKQTLELINTKSSQLENMIDTLINYTKLNNSELRDKLTSESITNMIKEFAHESDITGTIFKRKVITNINLPQDISVPLNKQLIQRVFENLFSNAVRYTKEDDSITINSYMRNSDIILEIKDTGFGIQEKDLTHIFDLFYRGTNSRREEGMGIGLSVVKNIIEIHDWNIDVSSKIDEGSCFTITIPTKKKNELSNI